MKKADVKVGESYRVKVSGTIATVRITGENPHGGYDGINTATNRKVRLKSAQRLRGLARRPAKRKVVTSAAEALAAKDDDVAKTVDAVEKGNLAEGVTVPTGGKKRKADAEQLKAIHKADQENARLAEQRAKSSDGKTASERAMDESAQDRPSRKAANKAKAKAKKAAKRDTGNPPTPRLRRTGRRGNGAERFSGLDAAAVVLEEAGEPLNAKQIVERMLAKKLWATTGKTPHATIYAAMLRECAAKGEASRFRKVSRGKFTVNTGEEGK